MLVTPAEHAAVEKCLQPAIWGSRRAETRPFQRVLKEEEFELLLNPPTIRPLFCVDEKPGA